MSRPSTGIRLPGAKGLAGSDLANCSSIHSVWSAAQASALWRLILAPPQARRFVVAHEVAHLVHLNHGRDFKALERQLYGPGLAEAQALLRRVGPRLKRVGRGR